MDFAAIAIKNKVVTLVLVVVMLGAGAVSYGSMSRLEDPEFTIKDALVITPYPGASPVEVEQEVSDRITAPVGSKAYGALSVGVRSVATVERLFAVGRGAFRPVPGVDSAVIRIKPLKPEPLGLTDEERLRTVVRAAFQWRRKQLGKILRDHPDLSVPAGELGSLAATVGFELADRPERLSPEGFIRLAAALPSF